MQQAVKAIKVLIPPAARGPVHREYDIHGYKERRLVECFFAKIKLFRSVATRYDELARTFKATLMPAACLVRLQ